jgi:small subunit ribosomal protein S5
MRDHQHELSHQELVDVRRCTKVVKGGRRFSFAAVVVVGDGKGRVGYGSGKATEVTDARTKATQVAKKNLIRVPLRGGRTLHHDVIAKFCSGKVVMRAAPAGTGIIAGGALRKFFTALGIKDIVVKSIGSSNPHNMIQAAIKALQSIKSPRFIAEKRGKSIGSVVQYREIRNNAEEEKADDNEE